MYSSNWFFGASVACITLTQMIIVPTLVAAQPSDVTSSITSVAPRTAIAGKLATQTEIIPERQEAAMLSLGSLRAMANAIGMYETIEAKGGWPALGTEKLQKGVKSAQVIVLKRRLIAEGYMRKEALASAHASLYDGELVDAIRAFQANHGVAPSGLIDMRTRAELNIPVQGRLFTLRENYPRIAEYMKNLGPRYVLVNIPSAQLETVSLGKVYSRHNVVVGKLERPTPVLMSKVSVINFNPYWNAPNSIVAKDIIPRLNKDPTYLEQMRMRVYDGSGREIDSRQVDWNTASPGRYLFRQDPGDNNAMARVKINFPNSYAVYLHDTPHRELFDRNGRFESSGCVRIDQVDTVVEWILNRQNGFNAARFEEIYDSNQPLNMPVKSPTAIRIMYLTAWASEDGRIQFRPDIYGLDGKGFVAGQPAAQEGI